MDNSKNITTTKFRTVWDEFANQVHSIKFTPEPDEHEIGNLTLDFTFQKKSSKTVELFDNLLNLRDFHSKRKKIFEPVIGNPSNHLFERNNYDGFFERYQKEFSHIDRIKTVIHIGIGGNEWGTKLLVDAFKNPQSPEIIFLSSFDPNLNGHLLQRLDAESTLVVVVSRTLKTKEVISNLNQVKEWLKKEKPKDTFKNIIGISENNELLDELEIPIENKFVPDGILGRFSLWTMYSLTAAIACGADAYSEFIKGAQIIDKHFREQETPSNIPILMAMHSIINQNIFEHKSTNIAIYDPKLKYLNPYLQQLKMESLGKSVTISGDAVELSTEGVVWGLNCTQAHHTYFQWLHQGMHPTSVDFIANESLTDLFEEYKYQRELLYFGNACANLPPSQKLKGTTLSNSIKYKELTPRVLGSIIALYEHETFVKSVIWDINPYDQWGVDWGKQSNKGA